MRVALAGGGIVGICTAIALCERNIDVTVFEPEEPVMRTAGGSACYLTPAEIFPLANPQTLIDLPKMLFDSAGPLAIRARHLPYMVRWGLHFLKAARPVNVARGVAALSALNRHANDATFALARRAGAEQFLDWCGGIHVARNASTLVEMRKTAEAIRNAGMPAELLDTAQLLEREPELSPDLAGGVFLAHDARVRDPERLGKRLVEYFQGMGGTIVRQKVHALAPNEDGSWRVAPSSEPFSHVVVTAGAWSHELLQPLGYHVPLDTERGYNITLPQPAIAVNHALIFAESRMAITPLDYGLRVTGTVEFAGLQAPPNWHRSDMLVKMAREYFPKLQCENAARWMGFRPALPDALPAIGKSAHHNNLLYAFGHEHLGLTQAAITGQCVGDLMTDRRPPVDLLPFDLERFRT